MHKGNPDFYWGVQHQETVSTRKINLCQESPRLQSLTSLVKVSSRIFINCSCFSFSSVFLFNILLVSWRDATWLQVLKMEKD